MVFTCPVRTVGGDESMARGATAGSGTGGGDSGDTGDTGGNGGAGGGPAGGGNSRGNGPGSGRTRRWVIRAGGVLSLAAAPIAVAGCDLLDREPDPAPPPDPVEPLITGALDLAIRYDGAIAAFPGLAARLGPVAEAHRAHAAELARGTGTPLPTATGGAPGGSPASPGGDQAATLGALRAAEQQGRQAAVDVCLKVPAERAALVGSIAAARATHLEVLR